MLACNPTKKKKEKEQSEAQPPLMTASRHEAVRISLSGSP